MANLITDMVADKLCKELKMELLSYTDAGTFKAVYKVRDSSNQPLAMKIWKSDGCSPRTDREMQALMKSNHESIVRLHDYGTVEYESKQYSFSIEEFLDGGTLSKLLINSNISPDYSKSMLISLSDVLNSLHSMRLVHRDIKPDNIMFRSESPKPVLVDFGLVRDLCKPSLTQSFNMRGPGTPYFASPEQLNNRKTFINWRSDQFSLGVTISLAVFGFHPYQSQGESFGSNATVTKVAEWLQPEKRFIQACKIHGLDPLVKMTQPWPSQRFRTPNDLIQELNSL